MLLRQGSCADLESVKLPGIKEAAEEVKEGADKDELAHVSGAALPVHTEEGLVESVVVSTPFQAASGALGAREHVCRAMAGQSTGHRVDWVTGSPLGHPARPESWQGGISPEGSRQRLEIHLVCMVPRLAHALSTSSWPAPQCGGQQQCRQPVARACMSNLCQPLLGY